MATKKKKVWPKIKAGQATAAEIRASVGVTAADHRRAIAAMRAAGIETPEERGPVRRRSKSAAANKG